MSIEVEFPDRPISSDDKAILIRRLERLLKFVSLKSPLGPIANECLLIAEAAHRLGIRPQLTEDMQARLRQVIDSAVPPYPEENA